MGSEYSSLPLSDNLADLETKIDSLMSDIDDLQTDIDDLQTSMDVVGLTGFIASDTVLIQDTTTYETESTSNETVITGKFIQNITNDSTIRVKVDIKDDGTSGSTYFYFQVEGETKFSTNRSGDWVTRSSNISVDWDAGAEFSVLIRKSVNNSGFIKNFQICGDPSPVKFT